MNYIIEDFIDNNVFIIDVRDAMMKNTFYKSALGALLFTLSLDFVGCSDSNSVDAGVPEYPYTLTIQNDTKGTAFFVFLIDVDNDTTITNSNPAKEGKEDYNINKVSLEKDIKRVEFTSGLKFTVYGVYDKTINKSTTLVIANDGADGYVVTKR